MKTSTRLISGLLATFAASIALAADIDMCATVPAADVESALGIKVGSTKKGLRECTWITPDYSTVVIANVSPAAKDGKLGKASTTDYVEQLKTVGRKATVTDDTPTLWCAKIEGGSPMVQCWAIAKASELSVVANGSTMTPAQVKALVREDLGAPSLRLDRGAAALGLGQNGLASVSNALKGRPMALA